MTAVIVAHDGATWLPHVLDALLEQTRPVQRVVAVDTGSRDRSGAVLAAQLGQGVVFGMDRATGYGAAVARALQHRAATTRVAARPGAAAEEQVEWIWLLHDDSEPAPDALEQLLRGAAETPKAAVIGPKVMDWADRDVLLETGLTIDTVGRRVTGIEPREVDQGQHDGDRDTLAVSSAGMLVRRDVWEQLRGFDPGLTLFREDMDFCWRVHAAGYRVRVVTDAIVYHAQAMTRRRRAVSVGRRAQLLDRRNALLTLAGNLPLRPMLRSMVGNVTLSILRALFFLVAKRATAALDETAAVASVLGHPLRLRRVRQLRARGRKAAYGRLRADIPPGRSVRQIAEFVAAMSSSAQQDTRGSHHATEDPDGDDFLLTDTGLAQRILTSPGVLLFVGLLVITGIAERSVIGAGTLGGGALLPATQGAAALWHQYLQGFHPTGIGSPSETPPYLAIVAALSTVLLGKAWLAVDVLLLASVPIAGLAAFRAARQVTTSVPVRIWVAATYALIPVASGAIAAGRLGTAAAFAAIPMAGLLTGRMFSLPPRLARRAAWATGLTIAFGTAFVPLLWPIAVLAAVAAAVALRGSRPDLLRNLSVVVLVPLVLLVPWTFQLFAHPATLLLEAGVQQPGLARPGLPASSLLLLSPGGPGLPPVWVTAGLAVAALVALLASRRRPLIMAGWTVALIGLLVAAAASRFSVRPPAGGPPVTAWPGVALAVTAAGLLLAAAAGAGSLRSLLPGDRGLLRRVGSVRGAGIAVLVLAACSAPVAAGGFWLLKGVTGPVRADSGQVVPGLVGASAAGGAQVRTLVLSTSGSKVSYLLLRGSGPVLGDGDLIPVPAAERALRSAVATLVAPAGGQAANQGAELAHFDIGFVLMRAPVDPALAQTLDGVAGLRRVSITPAFDLWRLGSLPERVSVVEASGAVVPVPSGPVGVSGAAAPAAGGILTVSEPAGDWHASLNGHPLAAVASPAGRWAQAFRLPGGGGTVQVSRGELAHDLGIGFELLAFLVVAALALPGVRTAAEAQLVPAAADAGAGAGLAGDAGAGAEDSLAGDSRGADSRAGAGAGERTGGRAAARVAARDGDRRGGKGRSRGRGAGHRGRKPGADQPLTGTGRVRAATGRGAARDLAGTAGAGTAGAAAGTGAAAADFAGNGAAGAGRAPRAAAWPAGQPNSRFFNDPPPRTDRPDPGYDAGEPGGAEFDDGAADRTAVFDRTAGLDSAAALDSTTAFDRAAAFDSTAAFDRSAPGGDAGRREYDSREYDSPEYAGAGYDSAGHGQPGQPDYGQPEYGRADYGRPDDGDGYDGAGQGRGGHRAADSAAPYSAAPGYGHDGGSGDGYRRADVDPYYGGTQSGGPEYGATEYGGPEYGGAGYGADGADPGPGRRGVPARSAAGAWPYPDDADLPGASRPPADRISQARLPGQPVPGQPFRGQPGPGQSGPGQSPAPRGERSGPRPPEAPYGPVTSWPDAVPQQAPRPPAPPSRPVQPRPDPGWPDDRWQDARRAAAVPAPAAPSEGWPEPDAQAAWPDSGPPATSWQTEQPPPQPPPAPQPPPGPAAPGWPDAEQPWAPAAQPAGWGGSGDSLEPLPSSDVHHGGPAGPAADDRSRRRWPAPENDEDERDAW